MLLRAEIVKFVFHIRLKCQISFFARGGEKRKFPHRRGSPKDKGPFPITAFILPTYLQNIDYDRNTFRISILYEIGLKLN